MKIALKVCLVKNRQQRKANAQWAKQMLQLLTEDGVVWTDFGPLDRKDLQAIIDHAGEN